MEDLEPLPLLDSLFSKTVLTREEYDTVRAKEPRQEQARCLLDLLQRKGRRAFEELTQMLGQGPQKHLNDNLLEILNNITEGIKDGQPVFVGFRAIVFSQFGLIPGCLKHF